jgi:proteic killer suppression protein
MAIQKFRNKGLRELFEDGQTRRIQATLHRKLEVLLDALDAATDVQDVAGLPKCHPLKGDRAGVYSVTVTGNWRLTFRIENMHVTDVDFEDYHKR